MHYYSLFGWNVSSEFELPELFPGNGEDAVDIVIKSGKIARELKGAKKRGIGFQVKPGHYQLNIDNVARFYVLDGNEILIDVEPNVDFKEVKVFLFASVLGGLCHLRNTLPIHASAIASNGKSFLFAGNSGSGKSTLVAALQKKGFLALSDDLCPIMFDGKRTILKQGIARMKLWPDALEWLGRKPNPSEKIREDLEKYAHEIVQAEQPLSFPVKNIYILRPNISGDNLSIHKLEGREKLVKLMRQTYRTQLIPGLGLEKEHFKKSALLNQQIDLFEIQQPRNTPKFQDQIDLIIKHIKEFQ